MSDTTAEAAELDPPRMPDESANPNPSDSPNPNPNGSAQWFSEVRAPGEIDAASEYGDPNAEPAETGLSGQLDAGEVISREGFFGMFRMTFAAASMGVTMRTGLELKSLPVAPNDQAGREASDTLYSIIDDTPALRWMLHPKGEFVARLSIVGGFLYAKYSAVSAEIRQLQAIQHAQGQSEAGRRAEGGGDHVAD